MATVTVREIDDDLKTRLRARAEAHGRSVEEEVREILRTALDEPRPHRGLGTRIYERFAPHGGVDLPIPERAVGAGERAMPSFEEQLDAPALDAVAAGPGVDLDLTDPSLIEGSATAGSSATDAIADAAGEPAAAGAGAAR